MGEEIHITEGPWQVCSWRHTPAKGVPWVEYVVVEHRCKQRDEGYAWLIHAYHPSVRGRECPYCHKTAPEGIQAMHWFLHEHLHKNPNMIRKLS